MKYILIISFALLTFLCAEQNDQKLISLSSKMNQYQKDFDRLQMLREAKFLKKKYEESILKLQNWETRKEELKAAFAEKYRVKETSFGEGNEYGKQRARKRKQEYYDSLQTQEQHVIDSFTTAQMKFQEIKEEFMFRYSVPLTDAEINDRKKPVIEDKAQRLNMLQNYINENYAWKKCQERVFEFDRVKNVANSIEKLFPDANLTQSTISEKSKQNQIQMQNHLNQYLGIDELYKSKYGVSIFSEVRAKSMLEYIKNN